MEGDKEASGRQPGKREAARGAPLDSSPLPPQVQPYAGGVAFLLIAAKGPYHPPTFQRWKCGKGEPGDVFPAKITLSSLPVLQAKVWTNVGALKKWEVK